MTETNQLYRQSARIFRWVCIPHFVYVYLASILFLVGGQGENNAASCCHRGNAKLTAAESHRRSGVAAITNTSLSACASKTEAHQRLSTSCRIGSRGKSRYSFAAVHRTGLHLGLAGQVIEQRLWPPLRITSMVWQG